MAGTQNLRIRPGDAYAVTVSYRNSDDSPVDLTGESPVLTITAYGMTDLVLTDGGGLDLDELAGTIGVVLSEAQTRGLAGRVLCRYALRLQEADRDLLVGSVHTDFGPLEEGPPDALIVVDEPAVDVTATPVQGIEQDLGLRTGDAFDLTIDYVDVHGVPIDLSAESVQVTVTAYRMADLVLGSGGVTVDGPAGKIYVHLSAEQTAALADKVLRRYRVRLLTAARDILAGDIHPGGVTDYLVVVAEPEIVVTVTSPGIRGARGPIGPMPETSYLFEQVDPDAVWTIDHQLGFDPAGVVVTSDGWMLDGFGVQYLVAGQTLRLSFDDAYAGTARLS